MSSRSTAPPPFDLDGLLPWGVTAIEASAGTGKTYTLARLVVRYVAEADIKIDQILVVTFTRAAASELRERVRDHLVDTIAQDDPELAPSPLELKRLEAALSDFDSATITTIHGFAQQVLATLGSGAPGNPDARLINDTSDLVTAVASDRLAALSLTLAGHSAVNPDPVISQAISEADNPSELIPDLDKVVKPVKTLLNYSGLHLAPRFDSANPDWSTEVRRHLIEEVAQSVLSRRQSRGTMAFDDILSQLAKAVNSPTSPARSMLAERFPVALIDEFQDTDPVQWDIFSAAFGRGEGSSLVLVGDPKQSIYAFRGANIGTYSDAVKALGTTRFSLPTNWRSSGRAIEALDHLLTGATFGPDIEFARVQATPENQNKQILIDDTPGAGLSIRRSGPETWGAAKSNPKSKPKPPVLNADSAETLVRADLVNQILYLLENAQIPDKPGDDDPDGDDRPVHYRPVRPNDIAVLTDQNRLAELDKDALADAGIPAVVLKGDDVFATPAAAQWRRLLLAVSTPENNQRARACAIGWFFGWSYTKLDQASDSEVASLQSDLKSWSDILDSRGPAQFFTAVLAQSGVSTLVMADHHGDRNLTDLTHLSEILRSESAGRRLGATGIIDLMDQLSAKYSAEDSDTAQRRVETDSAAVSVLTMHSAKGLEFPIVCCTAVGKGETKPHEKDVIYYNGTNRVLDIRGNSSNSGVPGEIKDLATTDRQAERLRLTYVALTRAKYHTICWWANTNNASTSPLATLLFTRDENGDLDPNSYNELIHETPDSGSWDEEMSTLILRGKGSIVTSEMPSEPQDAYQRYLAEDADETNELAIRSLNRPFDRLSERWSFSSITTRQGTGGGQRGHSGTNSADGGQLTDEPPARAPISRQDTEPSKLTWGDVPGSAAFGTLVHRVFEEVDFASSNLESEVTGWVSQLGRAADWPADEEIIAKGIVDSIRTPLGPRLGLTLADISRTHRLDELEFELNLGEAGSRTTGAYIGELICAHLEPDHPLTSWASEVREGLFEVELAGHMTGSIDLVMRLPDDRYVIADYKTNKLGTPGQPATASDYAPELLPAAMAAHHYPLQGLLYSVAMHRYLRWRLKDYSADRHLGGMAYLFVRGMSGASTPPGQGVFYWKPPTGLVTGLSDLLHGSVVSGASQ